MDIIKKINTTNNLTKIIVEKMKTIIDELPKNHIIGYCTDGPIFGHDPDIIQIINKYEEDLKKIEKSNY